MSLLVIILLITVFLNASVKVTVEYTANDEQVSIAATIQYLFFHWHKHFTRVFGAEHSPSGFHLPAFGHVHFVPGQHTRQELKKSLRKIFRFLHIHELSADLKAAPAIFPLATTLYGVFCAVLGACHIKDLPLQITLTPLDNKEWFFLYGHGIFSMSIGHIMYAVMMLSSQLFKQYLQDTKSKERRIAGERASY